MWGIWQMPKSRGAHRQNLLTALAVRAKGKGRHGDGGGLFLVVDRSGARRWLLRMMVHGRRRDIGLGSVTTVSLADAREEAARMRKIARAGGDPVAERRRLHAPTFEAATRQCLSEREGAWRNKKHRTQWLSTLETYAFPLIGQTRVDLIDTAEVLTVLTPIWLAKRETARRVRQRVGLVLEWAKAKGFRKSSSPTREIGRALPVQRAQPKHHRALPYAQVPAFLRAMRLTGAAAATKDALEWLTLTATRTGETLGARLSEIDEAAATWTIPAERMKSGREHIVPLSARALEILAQCKARHSGQGNYLFESKPDKPLSNMAMLQTMTRMKAAGVPHGMRSAFRDWCAERANVPREVAEACLAHVIEDKVERAYKRTTFMERRAQLMALWADYCLQDLARTVPFARAC